MKQRTAILLLAGGGLLAYSIYQAHRAATLPAGTIPTDNPEPTPADWFSALIDSLAKNGTSDFADFRSSKQPAKGCPAGTVWEQPICCCTPCNGFCVPQNKDVGLAPFWPRLKP